MENTQIWTNTVEKIYKIVCLGYSLTAWQPEGLECFNQPQRIKIKIAGLFSHANKQEEEEIWIGRKFAQINNHNVGK